jgi:hypothetical protein
MVGRKGSLEKRIEDLEAQLIEPPKPVCSVCGKAGGTACIIEKHLLDGTVTYGGKSEPPCGGCEAVNRRMGRPSRIVICEFYAQGPEGASCPVCGQESLTTIRRKLAAGEMTTSEVPSMVEVNRRRINREEAREK